MIFSQICHHNLTNINSRKTKDKIHFQEDEAIAKANETYIDSVFFEGCQRWIVVIKI